MRTSNTIVWLSSLICLLALVAAGAGLFWPDGGSPFSFTAIRGEIVQIYGRGLYPGFAILGLLAIWVVIAILRKIPDLAPSQAAYS